jgi:hypothetical protein
MSLPHDNATANLVIDGLAICCFNRKHKPDPRWEIGLLRHPDHHLEIMAVRGSERRPYSIPQTARSIEFTTSRGQKPDYSTYKDGFFDVEKLDRPKRNKPPVDPDHRENYRWTLDLDDDNDCAHGKIVDIHPPSYGATVAYLDNALLYTITQTPSILYLVPEGFDPRCKSEAELERYKLGLTNDQIGADITCKTNGAIIILVDGEEIDRLDHVPGDPWHICILNMRPHDHHPPPLQGNTCDLERGDFQLYYDAVVTSKKRHEIWGFPMASQPDPTHCAASRSGRTDCNTMRVGENIDNLDDLLT